MAKMDDVTTADAAGEGMSGERLDRIEAVWKEEIDRKSFPGAVTLIARNGRPVYFRSVGHLDAAQSRPMPRDAVFNIASLTKPIVSTAAMALVEMGRLCLGDPIGMHLEEFAGREMQVEVVRLDLAGNEASELVPARRPITVQDLLRHTSGFTYAARVGTPMARKLYEEHNIEARLEPLPAGEMLRRLATIPLVCQPGEAFHYSVSTDVLGLLLERVTGKSLDAVLRELVTEPLGMRDTGFVVRPEKKDMQPEFFDTEPGKANHERHIALNGRDGTTYYKGGGGLMSTVADYYRFALMLLNGGELDGVRLLSPKTVETMTADHLADLGPRVYRNLEAFGSGTGFGLGFGVRAYPGAARFLGSAGDFGWGGARGHYFFVDPRERLIGIFMSHGSAVRLRTREQFKNMAYAAVMQSNA